MSEVSVSAAVHHRVDDLRRFAASLASGLGVSPPRASALASHLLWFDSAGLPGFGIATLPAWLDRIDRREVDPRAEGRIGVEHAGTAVLDGQNGLAPLILARAAGIAAEKARDVGQGVVRVVGLGAAGPAAPIAADLAIGPHLAAIAGPGPSWALAIPSKSGLPSVVDSGLDPASGEDAAPGFARFLRALAGEGGWAIFALTIPAFENLVTFQDRMESAGPPGGRGLDPIAWEASRRDALDRGIPVDDRAAAELRVWADRLGVPPLAGPVA